MVELVTAGLKIGPNDHAETDERFFLQALSGQKQ
jgi:hypothetical protein